MADLSRESKITADVLEEGKIFDYITGAQVKNTDKEKVRQRVARAIIHEYGIAAEDMEPDFKVKVLGKNRKLDIAIFKPGQAHTVDNLYRAVVVEKEPKLGTKGAYRMRDPEEARKEFEVLETVMAEVDSCDYGLWTNGLEFFFFKKEVTRFDTKFKPIGDWPLGDDTFSVEGRSMGRLRRADPVMLRTAFRRCHNYIHGNEGMPKDAAFWQFLYLIFCKMYDEQQPNDARRFWVGPFEPFEAAGREQIRLRIKPLFEAVKKKYDGLFKGNEEITLSDRALAFIVSELARLRHRSAGDFFAPITIRMPCGGGIYGGQTHSQSPEAVFTHVSGLRTVMPSNPIDAKGLLIASMECDDPVIFLEPKRLYNGPFDGHHDRPVQPWNKHELGKVPEGYYTVPLDKAAIFRPGKAVTVLAYGTMVWVAECAARETGIDAEVIDLRSLWPLDLDTIVESVKKTGRCVVVHEATRTSGFGAELTALVQEHCFYHLEAPIERVTGWDTPYPHAQEWAYFPGPARVGAALQRAVEA